MRKVFVCIFTFILVFLTITSWIRLDPPASALLTLPKNLYASIIKQLLIGIILLFIVVLYYVIYKKASLGLFYKVTYIIVFVCALSGISFCYRVYSAPVQGKPYERANIKEVNKNRFDEVDLSRQTSSKQFMMYTPKNNVKNESCVVYLNYGGWKNHQNLNLAMYLRDIVISKNSSFCVFSGLTKDEGTIDAIVKDVKRTVEYLKNEKGYEKIILVGGSAGAHISLVTAFSHNSKELYGENKVDINGVIALYPTVDLIETDKYFLKKKQNEKNILDKLGDKFYVYFMKEKISTSIGMSHMNLMHDLLGGSYSDKKEIYEKATIKNLIGESRIPLLMIHGSHDSNVPVETSRELYNIMNEKNMPVSYIELLGGEHAFDTMFVNSSIVGDKVKKEVSNWLNNNL